MKLASLFDGISGFPLAATRCGIDAVWASEIEPYPIKVSKHHFPHMKHHGDISLVSGSDVEPVDIITFGSPCQDLSVAGKRAGLQHESMGDEKTTRSGLFMEAVRIIKEMHNDTFGVYPRYAVWENVPGAFSSNQGEDFRIVLEELIKIVNGKVSIPRPPKGKWQPSGCIMGDGYSLAWRVLDAQHWGVPQRRKRIFLILDTAGQTAPEILFKSDSVFWDSKTGEDERKRTPTDAEGSTRESGGRRPNTVAGFCTEHSAQARGIGYQEEEVSPTLRSGTVPATVSIETYHCTNLEETASTLKARDWKDPQCVMAFEPGAMSRIGGIAVVYESHPMDGRITGPVAVSPTVTSHFHKGCADTPLVYAIMIENHPADSRVNIDESGTCQTLTTRMGTGGGNVPLTYQQVTGTVDCGINKGTSNQLATNNMFVADAMKVRRLTPLECERLQGFPDGWTDVPGAKHDYPFWESVYATYSRIFGKKSYALSYIKKWLDKASDDSARYKAIGNSVAVPCVSFLMQRIAKILEEE